MVIQVKPTYLGLKTPLVFQIYAGEDNCWSSVEKPDSLPPQVTREAFPTLGWIPLSINSCDY